MRLSGIGGARLIAALCLCAAFFAAAALAVLYRGTPVTSAATTTVQVGAKTSPRDRYISANITIQPGDTVEWKLADGRHDVVEFARAFSSPQLIGSGVRTFSWTFTSPGLVGYYCAIHAVPGDLDTDGDGAFTESDTPDSYGKMVGQVVVAAPPTSTPTETETPDPSSTSAPSHTPTLTPTSTPTATPTWTPTATDTPGPNTVSVDMGNYYFSPKKVTVRPGDTIRWVNNSDLPHTTTSADGGWDSGIVDPGAYYEKTFNDSGAFDYLCELHADQGQSGAVEVNAETTPTATPDTSPTVTPTATAVLETLGAAQAPPVAAPRAVRGPITVDVGMTEYAFSPPAIEIYAGDTVRWTNTGEIAHNTTADAGLWSSATLMEPGETFSFTFGASGTYAYRCSLHAGQGQRGTIVVREGLPTALPAAGQGPQETIPAWLWILILGLSAGGLALVALRRIAARPRAAA